MVQEGWRRKMERVKESVDAEMKEGTVEVLWTAGEDPEEKREGGN